MTSRQALRTRRIHSAASLGWFLAAVNAAGWAYSTDAWWIRAVAAVTAATALWQGSIQAGKGRR